MDGRRLQRDLLRRDRDDERLECLRVHGRTEPRDRFDHPCESRIAGGPLAERVEVEREAEEKPDFRRGFLAPGLDRDATLRGRDPHLATRDDAM